MDQDQFAQRLRLATERTLEFSRTFVWNVLPEQCHYVVVLGETGFQFRLRDGETVYPEDVQWEAEKVGPLDVAQVVAVLWREGKVPEWIDMAVREADEVATYVELLCCARFTDQERLLYDWSSAITPFQFRGPALPPSWQAKGSGPFDLHWRGKRLFSRPKGVSCEDQ